MESKSRKHEKDQDIIKITPIAMKSTGGAGFKKGGFKSTFESVGGEGAGKEAVVKVEDGEAGARQDLVEEMGSGKVARVDESDTEDEGYECYDPRKPTDCPPNCKGRG